MKKIMATVVFIGISVVVGVQHTQAWAKNAFLLHLRTAPGVAFMIPVPRHGPQGEAFGASALQVVG